MPEQEAGSGCRNRLAAVLHNPAHEVHPQRHLSRAAERRGQCQAGAAAEVPADEPYRQ
jgi:hypothetical protein